MNARIKYTLALMLSIGLLTACGETRKKAAESLDEFSNQAEKFNNAVDEGMKQLNELDSVIAKGSERVKEMDSLVRNASSKVDSIAKKEVDAWKNILN